MERERRPAVMKFIGDYWDTVEDEHTIWSDVASFSLRQHTTKIFYVYPSILIFLVLFTPGSSMLKNNINPYSKTLIFFLNSKCSSNVVIGIWWGYRTTNIMCLCFENMFVYLPAILKAKQLNLLQNHWIVGCLFFQTKSHNLRLNTNHQSLKQQMEYVYVLALTKFKV